LSYQVVTTTGEMVAFAIVMVNENNAAHLTTIGVAPEHRRRKIAVKLLEHIEESLRKREIGTLMLEVRVSNITAQDLYRTADYTVVQRIGRYYNNGEDCYLMMKSLNQF
jgi:ribosomal-protein-alanine acetyltransferase